MVVLPKHYINRYNLSWYLIWCIALIINIIFLKFNVGYNIYFQMQWYIHTNANSFRWHCTKFKLVLTLTELINTLFSIEGDFVLILTSPRKSSTKTIILLNRLGYLESRSEKFASALSTVLEILMLISYYLLRFIVLKRIWPSNHFITAKHS